MHEVAAGKTATREKTKPRDLSVVRGGRGVAGRTVGLLGAIFTYAVRLGLRTDNPILGVVKFAEGHRQRRLTDDEYQMLGMALSKADQAEVWKAAVDATRLMIITGDQPGQGGRQSPAGSPTRSQCRSCQHRPGRLDHPAIAPQVNPSCV